MSDDGMLVEILLPGVNVDWENQGEELIHHLRAIVADETGSTSSHLSSGMTRADLLHPHVTVGVDPDILPSELVIVKYAPNPRCYVAVTDRSQIATQTEVWAAALRLACDRLNGEPPTHNWHAIIGHTGPSNKGALAIASPARIGQIYIHAATEPYREDIPIPGASLGTCSIETSYPVFVEGTSSGFDWPTASHKGAADLNLLCALLSLAFGVEWRIRQSLQPSAYDGRGIESPQATGIFIPFDSNTNKDEVLIPEWVAPVHELIQSDEVLLNAINAHHSGMALERVSTSYALLAYVGAIEGLGLKLQATERCDCCKKCTAIKGAEARFNASIALVCEEDERRLLARVYSTRSKTAHEGRLYGGERKAGALNISLNLWDISPETIFSSQTIRHVRDVSARLLALHLNRLLSRAN